jgi:hypothetical protein
MLYVIQGVHRMTSAHDNRASASTQPKKASLLHAVWIVVSGFFMIGRNRDYGPDAPKISPAHLVLVAIIGGVVFVGSIVTLVSFITK